MQKAIKFALIYTIDTPQKDDRWRVLLFADKAVVVKFD